MWWTAVNVHLCQFVFSMPAFHTHQSVSSVNWHLRHNKHQRNTCLLDANLSCAVSTSCISQGLSSQFVAYYSSPSLSTFCLPRGFFSAKMQSCKDEKSFEKGRGKSCQFFARPLFPHCHLESLLQEKKLFLSPLFVHVCRCRKGAKKKLTRFSYFDISTRSWLKQGFVFISIYMYVRVQESSLPVDFHMKTVEAWEGEMENSFYQNWMKRLWQDSKLQSDGGSIRMLAFEHFKIDKAEEFTIWYTCQGENSLGNILNFKIEILSSFAKLCQNQTN